MSDIIANAKQLLDGVTPGEWRAADSDIIAEDSNGFIATVSEYSGLDEPSEEFANVQIIAAAPELAQALAEETWEHRHEYRAADDQQWYALTPWAEGEPDCRPWNVTPTRIVRRRVSKPEVVNEAN